MPPEAATSSTASIQAWLGFLAPTIAVIVGFVLTTYNARKIAKKVENKVDATNQANSEKLDKIHKLVNGGRLGAALQKIDELEAELYESKAQRSTPPVTGSPDE